MPEGPELHLSALFINRACAGHIFTGKVIKSEVSTKNPDINWDESAYIIQATSRGKEIKLHLKAIDESLKWKANDQSKGSRNSEDKSLDIIVRFGMSGKFAFEKEADLHKHAHLNFYTKTGGMVLSFVDYRRFGRWEPGGDWGPGRGPCVILEYDKFRENVLENLKMATFNKPICEALLDQKYFNGIGNYLRAEILYRCHTAPFECARDVLQPLADQPSLKKESPDILQLCNLLPLEVVNLSGSVGYDPEANGKDYDAFSNWLQCYYNPNMKNGVDSKKRTIWYHGQPGPMAHKDMKVRGRKTKSNLDKKEASPSLAHDEGVTKQEENSKAQLDEIDGSCNNDLPTKAPNLADPNKQKSTCKHEPAAGPVSNDLRQSPVKTRSFISRIKVDEEGDKVETGSNQQTRKKGRKSPYFKNKRKAKSNLK